MDNGATVERLTALEVRSHSVHGNVKHSLEYFTNARILEYSGIGP